MDPRTLSSTPSPEDIRALQCLAHLVNQPRERERLIVLQHDWTPFPPLAEEVIKLGPRPTTETLQAAARDFFVFAISSVELAQAASSNEVGPTQVFRRHVIEGVGWDALEAELRERGTPVSQRTLKNRQRTASELILRWAAGEPIPEDGHLHHAEETRRIERRRQVVLILTALLVLIGGMMITGRRSANPGDTWRDLPERLHGRQFAVAPDSIYFPAPFPRALLPDLGSRIKVGMLLQGARPRVLLGTDWDGANPGRLFCWDPQAQEMLWESGYTPSREEFFTHDTVPEDAAGDQFGVMKLFNSSSYGSLGDIVAVEYRQTWSPCFIAFFDIDTGAMRARYAHPGALVKGMVLDFDADGYCELWLGGTDNVRDEAVLVALDPLMDSGAASTVNWQTPTGHEDALVRISFPHVAALEQALGTRRFDVRALEERHWDPPTSQLLAEIGHFDHNAYMATIQRDDAGRMDVNLLLGDDETLRWESAGIDPGRLRDLAAGVRVEGQRIRP